jgi:hypothetical protein
MKFRPIDCWMMLWAAPPPVPLSDPKLPLPLQLWVWAALSVLVAPTFEVAILPPTASTNEVVPDPPKKLPAPVPGPWVWLALSVPVVPPMLTEVVCECAGSSPTESVCV